jgi:hypothetical protein
MTCPVLRLFKSIKKAGAGLSSGSAGDGVKRPHPGAQKCSAIGGVLFDSHCEQNPFATLNKQRTTERRVHAKGARLGLVVKNFKESTIYKIRVRMKLLTHYATLLINFAGRPDASGSYKFLIRTNI